MLLVAVVAALHSLTPVLAVADPAMTAAPMLRELQQRQAAGGSGTPILSTIHIPFTALPEQVYPFAVLRGPQFGFNICNATTLGPNSNCQTLIFNGPDDFCLWGSPEAAGSIGNDEAKVVAFCTKPYHGTRLIPPGAITGLQWTKTSAYIQATGFIDNAALNLVEDDGGGELDPHGADLQGNPLGGVVYSNGTTDSDGHTLTQVFNWNSFVGSGQFCFKACFNSVAAPDYCENRFDLIGCAYNMPTAVQNGTYTECDGALQDPAGTYVSNGQTLTYQMPATLVAPPPYQPRVPSSSNCKTFQSTDLFLTAASTSSAPSSTTPSGTSKPTGTPGPSTGSSPSGSAPASTGTTKSGAKELRAPAALVVMAAGALAALL